MKNRLVQLFKMKFFDENTMLMFQYLSVFRYIVYDFFKKKSYFQCTNMW